MASRSHSNSTHHFGPVELPVPRKLYAGQPDPIDASHFTVGYEWPDGSHGIIDGWLLDDDSVKVAIRSGPGDLQSARDSMSRNPQLWKTSLR